MQERDFCPEGTTPAFEPQTRPDGQIVTLCEYPNGDLRVSVSGISSFYTDEEVTQLGSGSRKLGLALLGHEAYVGKISFGSRPYQREIEQESY